MAESAILLLDEPGLYLHARSQSDLLGHFEKDFKNQIVYTTHSPFMVPTHKLESVRTVSIDEEKGTTVTMIRQVMPARFFRYRQLSATPSRKAYSSGRTTSLSRVSLTSGFFRRCRPILANKARPR